MRPKHLKPELKFYQQAYTDNSSRRQKGYAWLYQPSPLIINLLRSNRILKHLDNKRVLDLGCGDGRHISYFRQKGCQAVGVDFCQQAINLCHQKFKRDKQIKLKHVDLTKKNALENLGQFDLVIDWSVLDHIRKQYLPDYLNNLLNTMQPNGYLVASEFSNNLPGAYQNKNYKLKAGHYSKGYTINTLTKLLKPLKLIDYLSQQPEYPGDPYTFNTVLMQKI